MCILMIYDGIKIRIVSRGTFGFPRELEWGRPTENLRKIDRTGVTTVWTGLGTKK